MVHQFIATKYFGAVVDAFNVDDLLKLDHGSTYAAQHARFPIKVEGGVGYHPALYLIEAGKNERGQNICLSPELTEKIAKIWKRKFTEYLGGSFEGCLSIKTIIKRINDMEEK